MNTDTIALNGTNERSDKSNKQSNNTAAAVAATAATGAAAGAAGTYAYEKLTADKTLVLDDNLDDIEQPVTQPAAEVATENQTVAEPTATHTAAHVAQPEQQPVATTTEHPTQPVEQPVQPVQPVVERPVEEIHEPDTVIDPQIEVAENPDDIADAIIAVDEVDAQDYDGDAPFSFTGNIEKVYDINGNETTQARYIDAEGMQGVMVDLDGDGVFDIIRPDEGGSFFVDEDQGFLTVADAECETEEGYVAYDETHDFEVNDDVMADVIDSEDFA